VIVKKDTEVILPHSTRCASQRNVLRLRATVKTLFLLRTHITRLIFGRKNEFRKPRSTNFIDAYYKFEGESNAV